MPFSLWLCLGAGEVFLFFSRGLFSEESPELYEEPMRDYRIIDSPY